MLVATLFNLITDLVGGIRLTVLEEEVVEKTASPMRRFATSTGRAARPSTSATPVPRAPRPASAEPAAAEPPVSSSVAQASLGAIAQSVRAHP